MQANMLTSSDGLLTAVVQDNGRGFDLKSARKSAAETRSIGLFSLEDRMRHLGGVFNVESEINRGSTITLSAPV